MDYGLPAPGKAGFRREWMPALTPPDSRYSKAACGRNERFTHFMPAIYQGAASRLNHAVEAALDRLFLISLRKREGKPVAASEQIGKIEGKNGGTRLPHFSSQIEKRWICR
jgi:hypothetical protein